jgi:hypothetical protein
MATWTPSCGWERDIGSEKDCLEEESVVTRSIVGWTWKTLSASSHHVLEACAIQSHCRNEVNRDFTGHHRLLNFRAIFERVS